MRILVAAIAISALAAPAAAEPSLDEAVAEAQRLLDDPRHAETLQSMIDALSGAMLDVKVGEIQAAAQGRAATPAEKNLTVRDVAGKGDPQFEAKLKQKMAQSAPALRQSMRALSASLPALAKSVEQLGKSMERLGANLPDPTYPKR